MKKILSLIAICVTFALASQAQINRTLAPITQGQFSLFGSTTQAVSDSIAVSGTNSYVIPVTHVNDVNLYGSFNWTKIGAGTATLTLSYFQSTDGVTYYPLVKGTQNTTYTKVLTLSASTNTELSLTADSVKFSGRYLKVQLATSATASVKGKYWGMIKTNIK